MSEHYDSASTTVYLSRTIWLIYFVFLLVAVPWYWRFFPDVATRIEWGMPVWVCVSVFSAAGVSTFTAWLLLSNHWPGENERESHGRLSRKGSSQREADR